MIFDAFSLTHSLVCCRLAGEYGLELVSKKGFHEFYREAVVEDANRQLLHRMNVVNPEGTMSEDEWEVAGG